MPPPKKRKRAAGAVAPNPNLPTAIKDVSPDRVGTVVQSFVTNDGIKQLEVTEQGNGRFTIQPLR
jgi:hypothetical protein